MENSKIIPISEEKCKGCPVFDDNHQENMIKNDICPKRDNVGCPREE